MTITINNKATETVATNLAGLALEMALPANGVAMALDNKMVPRAEWANAQLTAGASVIIIKAACGG